MMYLMWSSNHVTVTIFTSAARLMTRHDLSNRHTSVEMYLSQRILRLSSLKVIAMSTRSNWLIRMRYIEESRNGSLDKADIRSCR
jgi:hypothetical protein